MSNEHIEKSYENNTPENVIVTGGGSGIGEAICLRLASRQRHIYVVDIDLNQAKRVATLINQQNFMATPILLDVSDHLAVLDVLNNLPNSPNILINNAGVSAIGNLENTTEETLDRLYSVNVKSIYNCAYAVIPIMRRDSRGGLIINLASVASSVGVSERFAYSMSKGAVLSMTMSIAKDYVNSGIRCNCVSPGRVHTPFVDNYLSKYYDDKSSQMFAELSKSQPIGRMGQPEEVAALVEYLCGPQATFITGSNFPIDGGFVTLNS